MIVIFLTWLNIFGTEAGRGGAEPVYHRQGVGAGGAGDDRHFCCSQRAGHCRQLWQLLAAGSAAFRHAALLLGPFVGVLTILAVAQVGSLFSADAWNNVTFTAGEVKDPKRNLPLSLAIGTGVVILLYIAVNFIYLAHLPFDGNHERRRRGCPRHQVCGFRSRWHRRFAADVWLQRRGPDGHRHFDFHFRLL